MDWTTAVRPWTGQRIFPLLLCPDHLWGYHQPFRLFLISELSFTFQDYDKEVERNSHRWLAPKGCSQNASHLKVQPPVFDIYLCDSCDGEFDSLKEVQVNCINLYMELFILSNVIRLIKMYLASLLLLCSAYFTLSCRMSVPC